MDRFGFPVPFRDRGSIHFTFFSRPIEMDTTSVSYLPPPEVAPPEPVRSPPSLGLRSNPATYRNTLHQDLEAEALALLGGAIVQEHDLHGHGMN